MKPALLLFCFILVPLYPVLAKTSTGNISGRMTDVQHNLLAGTNIIVLPAADKQLMKAIVCDTDANFTSWPGGKHALSVACLPAASVKKPSHPYAGAAEEKQHAASSPA